MTTTIKSQQTKDSQLKSQMYLNYILDCIDGTGYDIELKTNEQKVIFLYNTFQSEYGYNLKRYGWQGAIKEYLMGLPSCINIEWENYKILQLAVKMGTLPKDYTEKEADKILENYFNFMAAKIMRLFRTYKLI